MPLLPQETFVFPDDLLTRPEPTPEGDARWWVLHTRPRAEKALARQVLARRVAFFLPLYHRRWCSRGRVFSSHLPLFPGYLFLCGDHDVPLTALKTNQVARVLDAHDQPRLWDDLRRVHRLMTSGAPLAPEDRLEPGARVEITSGPFAGTQGTILRRGTGLRFLVEVRFLQRGVSVEMENWMFQPVSSHPIAAASGARP